MNQRTKKNFKIMANALKDGSIETWNTWEVAMQTSYLQELLDMEEESMTSKEVDWCIEIIAKAKERL